MLTLVGGCPGDDGADDGATGTDSTSSTGTGGGSDATGTASMTGASGSQSGTSTTGTASVSTTDATGSSSADGSSTSAGSSGSTTGADACAGLGRAECTEAEQCAPIACRPFEMTMGPGIMPWCLGEPEYVGCRSADIGCAEVRTVACGSGDAPTYVCPDSCIPEDFMECDPPIDGEVSMCPGNGGGGG